MNIIIVFILFTLCIFSRIWVRFDKKDLGVDTWYYLNYAEGFRNQRRLPVRLGNYLLDIEEQWYPPFLPFLLSFLPKKVLDKYHWVLSGIIDSIQVVIIYIFSLLISKRLDVAVIASLFYISSTVNASMATNLNARPLANLVSTFMMLLLYVFSREQNLYTLVLILIIGAILLHTHKMATQQFVIFSIGLSFCYRNLVFLYIAILVFLSALVATKGFYIKIFKNNVQIVRFWSKNLPYLLKHQVYASLLYRNELKSKSKIGISGLKMNKIMFFIAKAYLFLLLIITIALWLIIRDSYLYSNIRFLFYWLFINYFTVIATTYFPYFKFIGEGFKYIIYGSFPLSLVISYCSIMIISNRFIAYSLLAILVSLGFYIQVFTLSRQKINVTSFLDNELRKIIELLKQKCVDNIICIPVFKAEPIAYLANKKVLWGAHGSGWDKMDEFWPIIKVPLENLIDKYKINFLLFDKRYVDVADLRIESKIGSVIFDGENYMLAKTK